MKHVLHRVKG